jgi:two-component system sensor kinase FixL
MSGQPPQQRQLRVNARLADPKTIEVAVTDTGPGIPTEKLDCLFEPFFTTKSEGLGMGLSISKTIIQLHGGRIWAENNAEGGATFRFTLPAGKGTQIESRRLFAT